MFRFFSRPYIVLFLYILIGCGVYFNALDNPFQHDDENVVVNNVSIRQLGNIEGFFTDPNLLTAVPFKKIQGAGHYRPLVLLSYAVNYSIGGLNPSGYHLFNLFFHIGASFLIFLIVKAMLSSRLQVVGSSKQATGQVTGSSKQVAGRNPLPVTCYPLPATSNLLPVTYLSALAAGLIFLVHPFNSEAVNYVTARSSVMSGFFYLLSFWCWVKYRELAVSGKPLAVKTARRSPLTDYYYIASLLSFAGGMLSKEVSITLPIMIWLYDIYGFKSAYITAEAGKKEELGKSFSISGYLHYIPFLLLVAVPYMLYRKVSLNGAIPVFQRDLWTQLFTELPVLVKHWRMFIWPGGLSIIHDVNIYQHLTGWVFFSSIMLVFFLAVAFYLIRHKEVQLRMISFFMLWFIIVLLPTTVIPLNAIFQENRGYLAFVSFAVLAGVIFGIVDKKRFSVVARSGFIVLLIIYSIVTSYRNHVWDDSIRIWSDAVKKAPDNAMAYAGLSGAYRDHGDIYLSIDTARRGIEVNPNYFYLRINLGRGYQLIGDTDGAIREYEKALEIDPGQAIFWNDLAILYVKKGDLDSAERHLRRATEVWGNMPHMHYNLAVLLAGRRKFSDAEAEFSRAIALNPSHFQARLELGLTLEQLRRFADAREQYEHIIRHGSAGPDPLSEILGIDKKTIEGIVMQARQRLAMVNKL